MPANGRNVYARPSHPGDGSAPNPSGQFRLGGPGRYSVPDIPDTTDPDYTDGFSPTISVAGSSDGTQLPDNIRTGRRKPPENDPNDKAYNARRASDFLRRHSVEVFSPAQPRIRQERPYTPRIPDQVDEKPPTRPTATRAPADALVTRPWHVPRNAADAVGEGARLHFSLADHRRKYPIMMQQPRGGTGNNIFRKQPVPWDATLYVAPEAAPSTNAGLFGHTRRTGI